MNVPDYHAKYFAYELTKRFSADSLQKGEAAVVAIPGGVRRFRMKNAVVAATGFRE